MKFDAFVGPSYQSQSKEVTCDETINLTIEQIEAPGTGKNQYVFYKRPGLRQLFQAGLHITLICPTLQPQVGVPYTYTFTATGGLPPYTWTILNGALPPGLTLDSATGTIQGTPTTPGVYSWTIQVIDSAGNTAHITCGQTVLPPFIIVACPSTPMAVGVPFSFTLMATGGTPPYTWAITAGALPDGLSLDPTTGTISGTPTTFGTFSWTATVTDSTGKMASINCVSTVAGICTPWSYIE